MAVDGGSRDGSRGVRRIVINQSINCRLAELPLKRKALLGGAGVTVKTLFPRFPFAMFYLRIY